MTATQGTTEPGPTAQTASQAPPFDIDILDPRLYDDPWGAYRWLRRNAPIWWDERNQLHVVSRHEDVSHISRHQELYSAAQGVRPKVAAPMSIISMDDPEHTRQRRLVNKGFTPRMVRQLSDHIRELANEIIDEISAKGACDFVEDFAIHVPLIVIAELMGLNPDERHKLYHWSDAMMAGDGHTDPDDPVLLRAAEAGGQFATMCLERPMTSSASSPGPTTRAPWPAPATAPETRLAATRPRAPTPRPTTA
jgi:cytochrome P450 family 142 subfamily A polypeptide 1